MTLAALVLVAVVLAVGVHQLRNWRRFQLASKFPQPRIWLPGIGSLADTIYYYGLCKCGNRAFILVHVSGTR